MEKFKQIQELKVICHEVRRRILTTVLNAGSGHLGGCLSSVESMVALYFGGILKYDPNNPDHFNRDRVLVRGHLGPLRYSIFSLIGWINESELNNYRCFNSILHGHEAMETVPGVDITPSGMLGMILSYGVGGAVALKERKSQATVYVFLGDGEEQEGNISEAARHASHLRLTNLVCIIDRNGKQLSQPTKNVDNGSDLSTLWKGYGWDVYEIIDGNDISQVLSSLRQASSFDGPTLFIAHTIKGKGLEEAEKHISGYHTLSKCPKEYIIKAIKSKEKILNSMTDRELHNIILRRLSLVTIPDNPSKIKKSTLNIKLEAENTNELEAGLISYFKKLSSIFKKRHNILYYPLTADVTAKELVDACRFRDKHICYIDVGIREQHLIAMAHGISVTDPNTRVLIVEGDPFLFRGIDQLHAVAQSHSSMIIIGADSGICEARNGATHQTTGQAGALINMPGLTLLEPADVFDLINCLNWALTVYTGPIFIRLHSISVEPFQIDLKLRNIKSYTAYIPSNKTRLIIVASGFPVGESVKLAKMWDISGIGIKVLNVINMRALDSIFVNNLISNIPVLCVYNGNPFTLQSAVSKAVMEYKKPRPAIILGHGFALGTTGRIEDLLRHYKLDQNGIGEIIKEKFSNYLN